MTTQATSGFRRHQGGAIVAPAKLGPVGQMMAVQFRRYGGPEVLQIVKVPTPRPSPHEVS